MWYFVFFRRCHSIKQLSTILAVLLEICKYTIFTREFPYLQLMMYEIHRLFTYLWFWFYTPCLSEESYSLALLSIDIYTGCPKKWSDFTMSYLQKYWIWGNQFFYSNLAWVEIVYWKILFDHLNPFKVWRYFKIRKFSALW